MGGTTPRGFPMPNDRWPPFRRMVHSHMPVKNYGNKKRSLKAAIGLLSALSLLLPVSCMEYGPRPKEDMDPVEHGVFIINEGNFTYGNATLSFYDPENKRVENEVFIRTNGIKLGDVAQSMVVRENKGYIVVNNSGIIFILNTDTYKITGEITGFTSPRHILFLGDDKAYVTDLYESRITVVNPSTREITGHIDTNGHKSTEHILRWGEYVFVNCWSYDNTVLAIDTRTDTVVREIEVGLQPASMAIDKYGKLWVLCSGGYEGMEGGRETPALFRINAESMEVEARFPFSPKDVPRDLCINGAGDTLYFINGAVWRMYAGDEVLPLEPFVADRSTIYYSIAADPCSGDLYVADAIDYRQPGTVYRYGAGGELIDSFSTGIIPGGFCFK